MSNNDPPVKQADASESEFAFSASNISLEQAGNSVFLVVEPERSWQVSDNLHAAGFEADNKAVKVHLVKPPLKLLISSDDHASLSQLLSVLEKLRAEFVSKSQAAAAASSWYPGKPGRKPKGWKTGKVAAPKPPKDPSYVKQKKGWKQAAASLFKRAMRPLTAYELVCMLVQGGEWHSKDKDPASKLETSLGDDIRGNPDSHFYRIGLQHFGLREPSWINSAGKMAPTQFYAATAAFINAVRMGTPPLHLLQVQLVPPMPPATAPKPSPSSEAGAASEGDKPADGAAADDDSDSSSSSDSDGDSADGARHGEASAAGGPVPPMQASSMSMMPPTQFPLTPASFAQPADGASFATCPCGTGCPTHFAFINHIAACAVYQRLQNDDNDDADASPFAPRKRKSDDGGPRLGRPPKKAAAAAAAAVDNFRLEDEAGPLSRENSPFRWCAYQILKREQRPMPVSDIVKIGLGESLLETTGKHPERHMARMLKDDTKLNPHSLFHRTRQSSYTLKEFAAAGESGYRSPDESSAPKAKKKSTAKNQPQYFGGTVGEPLEQDSDEDYSEDERENADAGGDEDMAMDFDPATMYAGGANTGPRSHVGVGGVGGISQFYEAPLFILRREQRPLLPADIVQIGKKLGLLTSRSKDPQKSIRTRLNEDIRTNPETPFYRIDWNDRALYGLKEFRAQWEAIYEKEKPNKIPVNQVRAASDVHAEAKYHKQIEELKEKVQKLEQDNAVLRSKSSPEFDADEATGWRRYLHLLEAELEMVPGDELDQVAVEVSELQESISRKKQLAGALGL